MPAEPQFSAPNITTRLRMAYDAGAAERDHAGEDRWRAPLRDQLVALLAAERRTRVLEIGAGSGYTSQYFADQGLDVVATDLSPTQVELCMAKGLTAYVRDFYNLGFPRRSFDAVWAMNCLLHVPSDDLESVLVGIRDVLAHDGVFCMGTWGGISREGIYENDSYRPRRLFALRADDDVRERVGKIFEVEEFITLEPSARVNDRLHVQFVRARRR